MESSDCASDNEPYEQQPVHEWHIILDHDLKNLTNPLAV